MEKLKSRQIIATIEGHAANMQRILDSYDYEIFCMPNIVSASKTMTGEDFDTYLKFIESIATGYYSVFDKDLTTLILVGLTYKARNLSY